MGLGEAWGLAQGRLGKLWQSILGYIMYNEQVDSRQRWWVLM